jgi:hypothetical protein
MTTKLVGPIGLVKDCLGCQQARTADALRDLKGEPGADNDNEIANAIAACLSSLVEVEVQGFETILSHLCGPCRVALDTIRGGRAAAKAMAPS